MDAVRCSFVLADHALSILREVAANERDLVLLRAPTRTPAPCRVSPIPYGRLLTRKRGTVPFLEGSIPSTSHTAPLRTSTSTQENGSRCAAQRVGGRLAVVRRKETAERVPLASTCVGSRSPVGQFQCHPVGFSVRPYLRRAVASSSCRWLPIMTDLRSLRYNSTPRFPFALYADFLPRPVRMPQPPNSRTGR